MPSFDGLGLTAQQAQLAGIVFAICLGAFWAWAAWKGRTEAPDRTVTTSFAVNAGLTDMSSVKTLAKSVEDLTMQMMKSAVAVDGMAGHVAGSSIALTDLAKLMTNLCGLVEQMLVDMREDREEQELATERQRGYEEGRRDADAHRGQQATPGRRTPPK
jgi:hypothetical protein